MKVECYLWVYSSLWDSILHSCLCCAPLCIHYLSPLFHVILFTFISLAVFYDIVVAC